MSSEAPGGGAGERWPRAVEIFESLVAAPPAHWPVLADQACGGDMELRRSVESLILADARAKDFLAPGRLGRGAAEPPAKIGPYKILHELGKAAWAPSTWRCATTTPSAAGW